MPKTMDKIEAYLRRCRELSVFRHENGWIDNDTLRWEVIERSGECLQISVTFDAVALRLNLETGRRNT
ncbi:MAG: hypothetical protein L0H63_00790 [Nitrococcus sp.]|nr:hypothetical protein [Nitrococcus sp.]